MNRTKDILYKYKEQKYRDIAKMLDISLGTLSKVKTYENDQKYTVDNAIIFAAGFGSRLKPLTNNTPKPLLKVDGVPMIETSIINLKKNGINEIFIVVGHLANKFKYLEKKYGVTIVNNKLFDKYNNISSLMMVKDKLRNTVFVEGDIYWREDIFSNKYNDSIMYAYKSPGISDEWSFDKKGTKLVNTKKGSNKGDLCWSGAYFLNEELSNKVKHYFENEFIAERDGHKFAEEVFWEVNGQFDYIALNKDVFEEIDTLQEYMTINGDKSFAFENPMDDIKFYMQCETNDIKDFRPVKGGLTNDAYSFVYNKKKYILRKTREETNANINRAAEYDIIESLRTVGISAKKTIFNIDNGIAIFEYIENNSVFSKTKDNIKLVAESLKKFHSAKLKSGAQFDVEGKIEKYTSLYKKNHKPNKFIDSLREDVNILIKKHFSDKSEFITSHNDLLPGNILISDNKAYIIDWELGGINHPYYDLASLFNESDFTDQEIDLFEKTYGKIDRSKLKDFRKVASYTWTLWSYQYKKWDSGTTNYFNNNLKMLRGLYE